MQIIAAVGPWVSEEQIATSILSEVFDLGRGLEAG